MLLYSYTCVPYFPLLDYSGYDRAGEYLSLAECRFVSSSVQILSLKNFMKINSYKPGSIISFPMYNYIIIFVQGFCARLSPSIVLSSLN